MHNIHKTGNINIMSVIYENEDESRILSYYDSLLEEYGPNDPRSIGWASESTEQIRYTILSEIGDLNSHSILDVGCGFGNLYDFLRNKNLSFSYKGIDINPKAIMIAKEKHPNINFETVDFGNYKNDKYDYIFCSGALSFKIPNYKQFYFEYIKKMFNCSTIGIAFNMLNDKNNTNLEDDKLYATYSVKEVQDFCLTLTSRITIRENYLPNDFTVYLYHSSELHYGAQT